MTIDPSWFATAPPPQPATGPVARPVSTFEPDMEPLPPTPRGAATAPVLTPPVLYVPCVRQPTGGDVEIQTRVMRDGRVALLAYTALDRLAAHCGHAQPWAAVETVHLDELDRVWPFDVLMLDLPVPHHARTHAGGRR